MKSELEKSHVYRSHRKYLTSFTQWQNTQTKGETRSETAEIPPAELNELLCEFVSSVRTKEGQNLHEPSSLRSMVASFERHIKRK